MSIKQLCLRGTTLKNTGYVLGIAVYTGSDTKIMKNAKHARSKMSSVLKKMNKILISVSSSPFSILFLNIGLCAPSFSYFDFFNY